FLQNSVNKVFDVYLNESQESLVGICGVEASTTTIFGTLWRGGYRMKKLGWAAMEQSTIKRAEYTFKIDMEYPPSSLSL
ncbi:hypothetical protein V5O48_009314, partial [Marasmius crinis-equi]